TVNMVRGPVHHGSVIQRLDITAQSGTSVLQLAQTGIAVSANTIYTAHAAVRASTKNKVRLRIVEKDSGGSTVATHESQLAIDTQDPQLLWVSFTTSATTATLDFVILGLDAVGEWMTVDAAQINPGPEVLGFEVGGVNLVANPSFEIDSNGDGLADSWTVSGAGITWSASRRSAYDQWSTGFSIEEFDLAVPLPEKPVV